MKIFIFADSVADDNRPLYYNHRNIYSDMQDAIMELLSLERWREVVTETPPSLFFLLLSLLGIFFSAFYPLTYYMLPVAEFAKPKKKFVHYMLPVAEFAKLKKKFVLTLFSVPVTGEACGAASFPTPLGVIPNFDLYILLTRRYFYKFGLILSGVIYLYMLFFWTQFNLYATADLLFLEFFIFPKSNFSYFGGVDNISLIFMLLTSFIFPLVFLSQKFFYQRTARSIFFVLQLLIVEILIINSFFVLDLLLFFVFFELIVVPVYLLIGIWGSRSRKLKANNYFLLYTITTSCLLLMGLILIYAEVGSTLYFSILLYKFSLKREFLLWFLFVVTFASKIPIFPFHIWLPEAHVEAPTAVSIILASLLLKLGGYGFIRFVIPLFPYANYFFWPIVCLLTLLSITYSSCAAISQIDIKKVIAYSSVVHMNFGVLGLFTLNVYGYAGSIFLMVAHGFTSAALFFCIGVLYDRYHTRLLPYYSGIVSTMPIFSIFFFYFFMSNIGFPGTANFVSEFLIFLSLGFRNSFILFLTFPSFLLSLLYCIFIFNKLCFGTLSYSIHTSLDINYREFYVLFTLLFVSLFFGVFPQAILNLLNAF